MPTTQQQKKQNPNIYWTEDLTRHFLQRRQTDGQLVHEKVLSITNHQGDVNQNHSEIPHTYSVQFCSVTQLCPTLCNPMTTARQASLVITNSWSPLKPMSIESVMPSNHLILRRPLSSCPQSFQVSGSFQMSQLFASGGQNIGVSASTLVPPINTQDWFRLRWTDWISLQSKGLSRVFSNTTIQKRSVMRC